MKAEAHPRQIERLKALRSYGILDTPRERDFDDIVQLASAICGTPISVVNLIDADRQWFKAEVGLGVRETPLDTSICSHVILENDFVEIGDTLADRRMKDNALCLGDPGLRFYAGVLLKGADELPLGTLCVLDYQPRVLTNLQKQTLQVLGRQVMAQLDLRLALSRQELLHKEIDHRVKNSLASVAAMVSLQMSRASDPKFRLSLEAVAQRIRTISLLHEELYQTTGVEKVDLALYFARLAAMFRESAPDNISILVEAAPISVNSTSASSLGVVVSEFVMNSMKHAFPNLRAGTIRIQLRSTDAHKAELFCEDDGVGMTNTGAAPRGLGLRLMEASAAALGGAATSPPRETGFAIEIAFPV